MINAALAAENLDRFNQAYDYYKMCADNNYGKGAEMYQSMIRVLNSPKNENKDDHVCVVNTGLHDQILLNSDTPPDQFLNNVRWYLKLLDSVCGNLVWVGLTAVAEIGNNPQRNSLSLEWNKQVYSALASDYKNNSFVIDVWEESDAAPFRGGRQNIHFEHPYYVSFASLYASLV